MAEYGLKVSKPGFDVLQTVGSISQLLDSNSANDISGTPGAIEAAAQSFISTENTHIQSVNLKLFKWNSPTDNLQLDIVEGLGGISFGSVVKTTASMVTGVNTFTFGTPVAIEGNVTYYLQLTRTGSRDTTNRWAWYFQFGTNPYSGGCIVESRNGIWSSNSGDLSSDAYFNMSFNTPGTKDLIFDSSLNQFKIVQQGTVGIAVGTTAGATATATIPHNLGYIPGHIEFYQHQSAGRYYSNGDNGNLFDHLSPPFDGYGYAVADGTNLNIRVVSNGGSYTAKARYYIYADPGG